MGGSPELRARMLRHIADHEPLESTLGAFGEVGEDQLRGLLREIAYALSPLPPKTMGPPAPARVLSSAGESAVRIYSDGASRGNPGPSGAGAVIARTDGSILERLGKYLGKQTNNHAEYMGVIIGLRRAKELGAREVEVYADSQLMIRQLGGQYRLKSPTLKPLFDEAMAMLKGFARVRLVHIPREMNGDADEMSNRAIDERL